MTYWIIDLNIDVLAVGPVDKKQPRRVVAHTVHSTKSSLEKLSLMDHATKAPGVSMMSFSCNQGSWCEYDVI